MCLIIMLCTITFVIVEIIIIWLLPGWYKGCMELQM